MCNMIKGGYIYDNQIKNTFSTSLGARNAAISRVDQKRTGALYTERHRDCLLNRDKIG